MKPVYRFSILFLYLILIAGCATKPQSDVDTPEYHFKAGMRAVESRDFQAALRSFQRSVDLDRKFALGYGGLGLTYAHMGNARDAKNNINKAVDKGGKDPDVLALGARAWIALRDQEKRWFKQAEKLLEKALKKKKNHEASQYYFGVAHLYNHDFSDAESYFQKVVKKNGEYAGKADAKWVMTQKIVRARPGSAVTKKVALREEITRADLAVLFAEELKIGELFSKLPQESPGFQTPSQVQTQKIINTPADAKGHWAETWISDMMQYGIMEHSPDGNFYPDETITRAEYAMAVQRMLVAATRDPSLETRYFGESPSRFSDIPSSHPAYNAMALCTERGIMQADVMTGKFNPAGSVSGADGLLIIRTLQTSLRMTF